jgi:hypothetical protein
MGYIEFLSKNGFPQNVVDIAKGLVKVPDYTVQASADLSFGFPPVLILLWSNPGWPGYIGIAKHWFGNRPDTFVQFYTAEYSFVEVARNFDQLKAWMVFDFLCNVPAPEEVSEFAESIGFCAANDVDDIFSDCEDISDLAKLSVFKDDLPAVIKKEKGKRKKEKGKRKSKEKGTEGLGGFMLQVHHVRHQQKHHKVFDSQGTYEAAC